VKSRGPNAQTAYLFHLYGGKAADICGEWDRRELLSDLTSLPGTYLATMDIGILVLDLILVRSQNPAARAFVG
jgi:hypothetical protein